jgi:hypothetical protein
MLYIRVRRLFAYLDCGVYAAKNSTVWKRFRCELIARQTSGSTKNVAADELGWFAVAK